MSVIIVLIIEHRYNKWGEGGREKAGHGGWAIGHGKSRKGKGMPPAARWATSKAGCECEEPSFLGLFTFTDGLRP